MKRYWDGVGPMLLGCWWAAQPGKVLVGFSSLFSFSVFLFSVLNFYFEFRFEFNFCLQIFAIILT
jgi:hypothetical protein